MSIRINKEREAEIRALLLAPDTSMEVFCWADIVYMIGEIDRLRALVEEAVEFMGDYIVWHRDSPGVPSRLLQARARLAALDSTNKESLSVAGKIGNSELSEVKEPSHD